MLGGFSLARNHASAERPLFFTTYAHRSPLYASPDFAGGETAHGIRHAYRDLIRFLNDSAIREQSFEKQLKECIESVRTGGLPTRVIDPDLAWLRTRLDELEPTYRRLNALENSGIPGVIYAVEFTPAEIPHLTYSWTSGVSVFCAVPASRIRHKVEITTPAEIRAECTGDRDMLEDWREGAEDGLLAALEKHGGWKQPEKDPSKLADVRMSLFDPRGGTDRAADIVEKFGHPHVKAALESDPLRRLSRF